MQKISDIISKEVISIYEGESVGVIKNVILSSNFKKIIAFVFFDEQSDFDFGVLSKEVYSFSSDGLLIKNTSKIQLNFKDEPSPINKKVFLLNGESYGKIKEIIFDESFNIHSYQTNLNKSFEPGQIFNMGFDICIIKQKDNIAKINNFKPIRTLNKTSKTLDNITVKLVKIEDSSASVLEKNNLPQFPIKLQANLESLLGKTSLKTITGLNNEIIIRQNAIVSKHTLNMAKAHNKTAELMFNTN